MARNDRIRMPVRIATGSPHENGAFEGGGGCERSANVRADEWASSAQLTKSLVQRGGRGHDLNDRLEPRGLRAAPGVQVPGRSAPRIVLHAHARREGHRLFLVAPDVELVDRRFLVDQLALLL